MAAQQGGILPTTTVLGEKHPETVWPLGLLSGLELERRGWASAGVTEGGLMFYS